MRRTASRSFWSANPSAIEIQKSARRYGRVGNKVVAIEKIAENAFEVVDVYRVENNNEEAGFIVSAMVEDLNESPDESVAMVFADHKVGDPTPFITKFNTQ